MSSDDTKAGKFEEGLRRVIWKKCREEKLPKDPSPEPFNLSRSRFQSGAGFPFQSQSCEIYALHTEGFTASMSYRWANEMLLQTVARAHGLELLSSNTIS